jgi:hypothetical protein
VTPRFARYAEHRKRIESLMQPAPAAPEGHTHDPRTCAESRVWGVPGHRAAQTVAAAAPGMGHIDYPAIAADSMKHPRHGNDYTDGES